MSENIDAAPLRSESFFRSGFIYSTSIEMLFALVQIYLILFLVDKKKDVGFNCV